MALGKCYECGKEASDTATKCPHCGANNPTRSVEQNIGETIIVVAMGVGALFVLVWAANSGVLPASWVNWLIEVGVLSK